MGATKDKLIGTAKQFEGKVTGDEVRVMQGTVQKGRGKAVAAVEKAGRGLRKAAQDVKSEVSRIARK